VDDLAKALSAFANGEGGHLILGVTDDGVIEGLPETVKGRIRTKDWIEQKIPQLLTYPLQDFRVHEVEPSVPSKIPPGHVIIVIDVGDSPLTPHQTANKRLYYYRVSGRTEPTPHFFLELLWGCQNKYPGQKVARMARHHKSALKSPLLSAEISRPRHQVMEQARAL
jgi:predicted HTH transcriptional regulator